MFLIVNRGKEVEDCRQNHQVRYLHASRELKCLSIPCMAGSCRWLYKYTSGSQPQNGRTKLKTVSRVSQIDLTVTTFIHLISFHFYTIIIYL